MPSNRRRERGDPQDLVVTLLAIYGRRSRRPLWAGGLVTLLSEFGFSTSAARAALSRLVRRGLMRRLKEGRLVFYEMTERCVRVAQEGDERILALGVRDEWDGAWTVVWQAIPEGRPVDRNRLARRLRFLGFRSVQDGIWIAPHRRDREALRAARDLDVERHVGALVGTSVPELPIGELVKRSWDVDALGARYERFAAEFSGYEGARLDDREAFLVRTRVAHAFWQFALADPDVPDALMPASDARRRAAAAFHAILRGAAEPAQRYFDAATTVGS